ncbi:MAG: rRNA maturation RNase YbeY [Patescibacteria group bacterium]|nr:rRNA maturation RNase YbeY [Patescibacteria group bacterium]
MIEESFTLNKSLKGKLPRLPFELIKNEILGKKYILTLNFVSNDESQKLNMKYRNKNEPTDILSFPLSDKEGEIYIDLASSKKEMKKFGRKFDNFIGFLFIHGLVHLKGFDHSDKMEKEEIRYRALFNI